MEIENLHRLVGLLQKFRKDGMLDNAAVEAVLKPVASMNEKLQEEYAVEMLSVLKTSGDKEEILSRQGMVLQMLYADRPYMDFGENPVQENEQESDPRPGAKQGARQNSESEGCSVGLNLYLTNFLFVNFLKLIFLWIIFNCRITNQTFCQAAHMNKKINFCTIF